MADEVTSQVNQINFSDNEKLILRIKERKAKLRKAAKELKSYFVGLDDIIDKIISNVETWYIMPELMTRPVIICLFGPTGVGKTDLVRRLVKAIDFSDRYCEVELASKGNSWARSIGSILRQNTNIESGKPSVLLLDEIQSFRTIDEEGADILDYEMKDIWTLLSDGKLPYKVEVESLMSMLWDYSKKEVMAKTASPKRSVKDLVIDNGDAQFSANSMPSDTVLDGIGLDDDEEEPGGRMSFYTLNYFKSVLRLEEPIEEIALWPDSKKKQIILQRLMDKTIYEDEDYTKSLIFISGNIDEAYSFAKNAKEVDVDADILHEMSKKISILDIKEALGRRFRPEQISRMGNVHVVYPSLSKKSFETIIDRRIKLIIKRVKDQTGIHLVIDKSIAKIIYDNGVFPTQGTRPVFSTIAEVLETVLPKFILVALVSNSKTIKLSHKGKNIVADIGGKIHKSLYEGSLDVIKIKRNKNVDRKVLSSVHEAGHAVVHAILFKVAPHQIVSTPISEDMEGFVYSQQNCESKEMFLKRICVLLAGQESERLVFGTENQTSGCFDDLRKATGSASSMIRRLGMSSFASAIGPEDKAPDLNNDMDSTNPIIESFIVDAGNKTRQILSDNKGLLVDVISNLMKVDRLTPLEFKNICKEHGIEISISKNSGDIIYSDFESKFEEFKSKEKS